MNRAYGFLVRSYMWASRQLVCRQAVALMSDYLDGNLSERDAARLEKHLAECPDCSEYLAQLRATIDALGAVTPGDLSPELLDDLVGLYRGWRADPA